MQAKLLILTLILCLSGVIQSNAQDKKQSTTSRIYFGFNSSDIDSAGRVHLNNMAAKLVHGKAKYRIFIWGYCDSVSGNAYNDALSLRRVEAAKRYLVAKGIDSTGIVSMKGFGKRKPLNNNKTETDRQQNRRVDIMVMFSGPDGAAGLGSLKMDTVKAGTHIVLKNLNFYGGLHHLLPGSQPVLDTLVKILKANPTLKICIQGHVCCTDNGEDGPDNETMTNDLSWNRAKEIYHYLIAKSISPARLSYIGMGGKNHLVDPEVTEEDRILNRRVEIVVVAK